MGIEGAWKLGLGVALAWAALPILGRLARRSRDAAPALHYQALVSALALASALLFAPLLRGWAGSAARLLPLNTPEPWPTSSSIGFVTELVTPLLGRAEQAWPRMPLAQLLSAVGHLWLVLFAAGLVLSLVGHLRLRRNYGRADAAPAHVLVHAARVAAELGVVRVPSIRVVPGLASAFTYGVLSPVIVLDDRSCDDAAALDFVLRHELCHVARHDTRAVFWIDLAQRGFVGHPCLRALAAEIRFAREASVDATAAGSRPLEYARFLLRAAERVRSARATASPLVSMADSGLERRVERLIAPPGVRSTRGRSLPWLAAAGLTLGSLVFLAPSSWARPRSLGVPTVDGNLSVEQVQRALLADPRGFHECYGQLRRPGATLFAWLSFEIANDGRVSAGTASTPEHPELEQCLQRALLDKTFPAPSSGSVSVDFPLDLTPSIQERQAYAEAHDGVSQRLPPDTIRAVVRERYDQFRVCYESLGHPLPSARVTMSFTIGRNGDVVDGELHSDESPALASCIDPVMRSMRFPPPNDGIVTVVYPIMFEPGDEPPPAPAAR